MDEIVWDLRDKMVVRKQFSNVRVRPDGLSHDIISNAVLSGNKSPKTIWQAKGVASQLSWKDSLQILITQTSADLPITFRNTPLVPGTLVTWDIPVGSELRTIVEIFKKVTDDRKANVLLENYWRYALERLIETLWDDIPYQLLNIDELYVIFSWEIVEVYNANVVIRLAAPVFQSLLPL